MSHALTLYAYINKIEKNFRYSEFPSEQLLKIFQNSIVREDPASSSEEEEEKTKEKKDTEVDIILIEETKRAIDRNLNKWVSSSLTLEDGIIAYFYLACIIEAERGNLSAD